MSENEKSAAQAAAETFHSAVVGLTRGYGMMLDTFARENDALRARMRASDAASAGVLKQLTDLRAKNDSCGEDVSTRDRQIETLQKCLAERARQFEALQKPLEATASAAEVREHPEYVAMLANLTATQARCTELLDQYRALKRELGQ